MSDSPPLPKPSAGSANHRSILVALLVLFTPTSTTAQDWFVRVTDPVGLTFLHQDGRTGEKHYVETAASGVAWIDFDQDDDLDLYLVNGSPAPGIELTPTPRNALFENRGGKFVDVASPLGVDDAAFGMGVCAGDANGDGWIDLFVTNYGPDRLYLNQGGRSFLEVAGPAGVAGSGWSSSCAFGDLDGDGDHDLYVTRYVDFDYADPAPCGDPSAKTRYYCRPENFDGVPDALYLNQGNGTFIEAGKERGVSTAATERGFGVSLVDFDLDGDLDIYAANDGSQNRLYENDGSARFEDVGLWSGAGLSALGVPEAGMGIAVGDLNGDLLPDLVVTHFSMETNTLYTNLGDLQFEDVTETSGLGPPSLEYVGWGVELFDFDNDGDLDLAVANGHMQEGIEQLEPRLKYPQPNQLFENLGAGRFVEVSPQAGAAWQTHAVSRGLAVGDWNNDGRLDVVISNTNDRVDLLENRIETKNHWLGLSLVGPAENRLALGAVVTLQNGTSKQTRGVRSGGSFQSQSDLRVHFGLGQSQESVRVDITWPNGRRQSSPRLAIDRYHTLRYDDLATTKDRAPTKPSDR